MIALSVLYNYSAFLLSATLWQMIMYSVSSVCLCVVVQLMFVNKISKTVVDGFCKICRLAGIPYILVLFIS